MNAPGTAPRMATLVMISALAVVPINIVLPSLANMATEFGVDYAVMGLALAAYAAASAVLQITLGPMSDCFGRRPVILIALTIFILATLGCTLAPDATTLLACRMIQAVIAPTYAVALAIIRDTSDRTEAASRIGYLSMAWAVAPMLAPGIGGLLDEMLGWRATFYLMTALGIAVFAWCWVDLGETNRTPAKSIVEQYRAYPKLLRSPRYWSYVACMAFSLGAFYAFLVGAPLVAGGDYNLSPALVGLALGSITVGFMAGSFLAGRLSRRLGLLTTLVTGRVVAFVGILLGVLLGLMGVDHLLAFFGPCLFVGVANGLSMPSANAGALSVHPELAGSAAGLGSAVSVAGAATISVLVGAVLPAGDARLMLLLIMLATTALALTAALFARYLELRESTLEHMP